MYVHTMLGIEAKMDFSFFSKTENNNFQWSIKYFHQLEKKSSLNRILRSGHLTVKNCGCK